MNRTGTALCDATAVLRAGEADLLANHPQKRGIRIDVDLLRFSVDGEADHQMSSRGGKSRVL
jgi:hypothetical protein